MATSGILALIDWEDFSTGDLHGQNGWRVQNEDGVRPVGFDSVIITEVGAPSGQIAMRNNPGTVSDDRRAVMVLDGSGVDRSAYDKVSIEAGMIMNQLEGRSIMLIRPSGATNDTLYGYRVEWEHNTGAADTLTFDRLDNGAITNLDSFNIDRVESLRLLVEDDDSNITIWANASGTWEFIHQEATTTYNYLPTSGAFQLRTDEAGLIHGIGDVTIYGVNNATATSGQIGAYVHNFEERCILDIDFENYTDGNLLTDSQPDDWWTLTSNGKPTAANDAYIKSDPGSGLVMWRRADAVAFPGKAIIAVLNSGVPTNASSLRYELDVAPDQAATSQCKADILFRPKSGMANNLTTWRFGYWRRLSGQDRFVLQELLNGGNVQALAYLTDDYTITSARLRVVDDGDLIQCHVKAKNSGIWEETHSLYDNSLNDQTPSGALNFDGDGTNVVVQVDNFNIYATYSGLQVTTGEIGGYVNGVAVSTSGEIGGYIEAGAAPTPTSGEIGGYVPAFSPESSGQIGGYLQVYPGATPEVFTKIDPAIQSWWYGNEDSPGDALVDYGDLGNDLVALTPVNQGILTSGVQTANIQRENARVTKNAGTGTNAKFRGVDIGEQYTGSAENFTWQGWIYPSGGHLQETQPVVLIMRDDQTFNNSARFAIQVVGSAGKPVDRLQVAHRWGAGSAEIDYVTTAHGAVPSGQFVHIAATYNKTGGEVILYVNGGIVGSGAITGVMGSGSADELALQGNPNPANTDFTGAANDIMFISRALSSGEVAYVAESGVGPVPSAGESIGGYLDAFVTSVTATEEQMQGVWRLDELGDNDTRLDSSGKSNHLNVITGSPKQVAARRNNGTRFEHWVNPFPSLQRTGSGVSTGLSPTASSWTMGLWAKPSGVAYERYAQLAGKGSYDQYVLYMDEEGEVWGQVSIDGIGYVVSTQPSSLIANEWQHIDWVVDRDNEVQYIYRTGSDYIPTIIGSGALPDSSKAQDTTTEPFHVGASPTNQQPYDGDLDEVYFIQRALSSGEILSVVKIGLPIVIATGASGQIGGYMAAPDSATGVSGQVGGYTDGVQLSASGEVGGYLEQLDSPTGSSGQIGGYTTYDLESASGQIGGYVTYTQETGSGQVGGYLNAVSVDDDASFLSMFTYVVPEDIDFDLIARIGSAMSNDFDATLQVLRQYTPPTVTCYVTGSGTLDGYYHVTVSGTVTVGDETIQNGAANEIESVWIQFGNMSGQQDVTPSDGVFEVEHTFTSSGVYIIRADAIDKQGTHGSCRKRVDLSVGLAADEKITLELTGTPQSGVVPHTIAFTQAYGVQPVGVKESIINFGDRTLSHYDDPTHLYHSVGNYIPVWIVRDDNGRFWCDSLVVGVNQ